MLDHDRKTAVNHSEASNNQNYPTKYEANDLGLFCVSQASEANGTIQTESDV